MAKYFESLMAKLHVLYIFKTHIKFHVNQMFKFHKLIFYV